MLAGMVEFLAGEIRSGSIPLDADLIADALEAVAAERVATVVAPAPKASPIVETAGNVIIGAFVHRSREPSA